MMGYLACYITVSCMYSSWGIAIIRWNIISTPNKLLRKRYCSGHCLVKSGNKYEWGFPVPVSSTTNNAFGFLGKTWRTRNWTWLLLREDGVVMSVQALCTCSCASRPGGSRFCVTKMIRQVFWCTDPVNIVVTFWEFCSNESSHPI